MKRSLIFHICYSTMRAKWTIALLLIVGGTVLQSGCVHEPILPDDSTTNNGNGNGNGNGDTTGNGTIGCDPDTVYFENDILPILISSCAKSGCHDAATATEGILLNNYMNIINTGDVRPFRPDNSDLYEVITDTDPQDRMPPEGNPQLTSYQIDLIRRWIMQGALNNKCNDNCDTTNVTYTSTIQPLLSTYCTNCHSGASPQGGINLSTYSDVYTKVQDGKLSGVVNHQAGYTPMPFGSSKLQDCQLNQIRIWIENGAPNN